MTTPFTTPDPDTSRYQPDGPHGPLASYKPSYLTAWTPDSDWRGGSREGQIIYENARRPRSPRKAPGRARNIQLAELASVGITMIEVMPIADFPGRFGWGCDGVGMFAPTWLYGVPDDMRAFVNEAHAKRIAVILDVVYNHLGPDGNYLGAFSPYYFGKEKNDWGDAINFDGEQSGPVREFFTVNACYWITEFHLDGLRLDATQDIKDKSPRHVLADIGQATLQHAAGNRNIVPDC